MSIVERGKSTKKKSYVDVILLIPKTAPFVSRLLTDDQKKHIKNSAATRWRLPHRATLFVVVDDVTLVAKNLGLRNRRLTNTKGKGKKTNIRKKKKPSAKVEIVRWRHAVPQSKPRGHALGRHLAGMGQRSN